MDFGVLVDVCLGVLALMILFTLAAAAINEMIADNILNMRGKSLHQAIVALLTKYARTGLSQEPSREQVETAVDAFYADPAIQALMEERSWIKRLLIRFMSVKGRRRPPSAIEPETFAAVAPKALGKISGMDMAKIKVTPVDFTLTMDRTSGWYVRKVRTSLFFIGLALAVGANVDLLGYAQQLSEDRNLQARIDATVAMVNALEVQNGTAGGAGTPASESLTEIAKATREEIADLNTALGDSGVEIGWRCVEDTSGPPSWGEWLWSWASWQTLAPDQPSWACDGGGYVPAPAGTQLIGWLVIAFGVTLGAQFWFDLFRSLVNLRTPGKTGGTVEALSSTNTPRDPGPGAAGARS
jgi:hypothetical protein